MKSYTGTEAEPAHTVLSTLHGPLAWRVDGELLVADRADSEINLDLARLAVAVESARAGNP
jgi:hypothetical protein